MSIEDLFENQSLFTWRFYEIRPPAAIYPLPYIKVLNRAAVSSFALDLHSQWSQGAVCSYLRHLRPFLLYQSKENI